jgi:hypothetical protein
VGGRRRGAAAAMVARRGRGGEAAASAWRGSGGRRRRVVKAEEVGEQFFDCRVVKQVRVRGCLDGCLGRKKLPHPRRPID